MRTFDLIIFDSSGQQEFSDVTSFVAEDASGSFGILAGHARMMTSLVIGLARFRSGEESWRYLALPGAILYFHGNRLTLSTRRCLIGEDYSLISTALRTQLLAEEEKLHMMKESLHRMEEEVLRRLWEMGRSGV
jgi:F-type H+-transporting ATPase subunit epsilon